MADDKSTNVSQIAATAQMAAMLNLDGSQSADHGHDDHGSSHAQATEPTPSNLPIIDLPVEDSSAHSEEVHPLTLADAEKESEPQADVLHSSSDPKQGADTMSKASTHEEVYTPLMDDGADGTEKVATLTGRALGVVKSIAPYLAIFIVAAVLYQFFFTNFSIANFLKSDAPTVATQSEQNKNLVELKAAEAARYSSWINQFFYTVNDPSIIDMDNDFSGNGLTNFQKYLLNLNPKAYDTLGLGKPDGQTILEGTNPWTNQPLSDNQKKIIELYFNKQVISDRLAAGSLKFSQGDIATAPGSDGYLNRSDYSFTDGGAGQGVSGNAPGSSQVAGAANRAAAGTSGTTATGAKAGSTIAATGAAIPTNGNDVIASDTINTDVPAVLTISSLNITTPIIYTKSTANFEDDLTKGTVHYPGTPMPGDIGTSYIAGHSSGYPWQTNKYKNIFRSLDNIKDGSSFTIQVTLKSGKKATIHYVVIGRQQFAPNDQAQFIQTGESRVALSTCWPLDTSARRLVVFAKKTQVSF